MTAPGNDVLYLVFTLSVFVSSGYAVGRIHQWHRQGLEQDESRHAGYDTVPDSVGGMMSDRKPGSPVRGRRAPFNQRQAYPAQRGKAGPARSGRPARPDLWERRRPTGE